MSLSMNQKQYFVAAFALAWAFTPVEVNAQTPADAAREFLHGYEFEVRPLEIAINKAWWNANTTGKDKDFAEKEALENRYNELLSSTEIFKQLKQIEESDLDDPQLARQIHLLYLDYLDKQVDVELLNRMSSKSNEIEKKFNVFRAKVGDKTYTDSEVREVLVTRPTQTAKSVRC